LAEAVHCRHCQVFRQAGRGLLERPAPAGYLEEWAALLAEEKGLVAAAAVSLMVFRLGPEWLAVESRLLREVAEAKVIHRLPHPRGWVVLGLVNVQGELLLCLSLGRLLGLDLAEPLRPADRPATARLLVLAGPGRPWAAPVDEIQGLERVDRARLAAPPATLELAAGRFCGAVFEGQGRWVGLLDEPLLAQGLKRSVG
jgi:chemotaxis-related protein WspD